MLRPVVPLKLTAGRRLIAGRGQPGAELRRPRLLTTLTPPSWRTRPFATGRGKSHGSIR